MFASVVVRTPCLGHRQPPVADAVVIVNFRQFFPSKVPQGVSKGQKKNATRNSKLCVPKNLVPVFSSKYVQRLYGYYVLVSVLTMCVSSRWRQAARERTAFLPRKPLLQSQPPKVSRKCANRLGDCMFRLR